MKYKNELFRFLKIIADRCIEDCSNCVECPFATKQGDCMLQDLFYRLSDVTPIEYIRTYIEWFNEAEEVYNELHKQAIK